MNSSGDRSSKRNSLFPQCWLQSRYPPSKNTLVYILICSLKGFGWIFAKNCSNINISVQERS